MTVKNERHFIVSLNARRQLFVDPNFGSDCLTGTGKLHRRGPRVAVTSKPNKLGGI
jgi:hypothetical protein